MNQPILRKANSERNKLALGRKKMNLSPTTKEAAKFIKEGKVIVCPTDTVYGLICDVNNSRAVKKLFKIKKRSFEKPIPVFVADIKMAQKIAIFSKKQEKFLKKAWPGKVTVIFEAKKNFPKGVLSETGKIGLRIPNYKLLNTLLEETKIPLSATSANISGKPASTKIKRIINQLKKEKFQPDLIIDVGSLKASKPSTVVDLTSKKPKILRKGEISREELKKLLNT